MSNMKKFAKKIVAKAANFKSKHLLKTLQITLIALTITTITAGYYLF